MRHFENAKKRHLERALTRNTNEIREIYLLYFKVIYWLGTIPFTIVVIYYLCTLPFRRLSNWWYWKYRFPKILAMRAAENDTKIRTNNPGKQINSYST